MHSYLSGLCGGSLIGLSAAILLLFAGEILGASGVISSTCLHPHRTLSDASQHWKLALLAAFCLTAHIFFSDEYTDKKQGLAALSPVAFVIGGFFVGFGTKLGNGCTSGHGICGLARLSKRSFTAVCTFMGVAVLTAYLTSATTSPFGSNAFDFLRNNNYQEEPIESYKMVSQIVVFGIAFLALIAPSLQDQREVNDTRRLAPAAAAGALFSAGLYVSQMVYPTRVLGFLNVALIPDGDWDATLMFVMGAGVVVSLISYQYVQGFNVVTPPCANEPLHKPIALTEGSTFGGVPKSSLIDRDLVLGAACFGIGWGISGLCPGPAIFLASIGISWVLVCYWPAFFVGAFLAERFAAQTKTPATCPCVDDQCHPSSSSPPADAGSSSTKPPLGSTESIGAEAFRSSTAQYGTLKDS